MKKTLILIFILLSFQTYSQVLKNYVEYGLENNLALKQKEADFKKSLWLLKEARSLFYPDISFNARYSLSAGGRVIEFPIGDLLNPVYSNLNNLYQLHGIPTGPAIVLDNQEFAFYRPTEQETKVRLVQPLFNPQIYFNHKIKHQLTESAQISIDLYEKSLVAEIKTAYYNYQQATQFKSLLQDIKLLLDENLRVNESLYKNDKVTIDHVYRSQAELSKLDQEFSAADKGIQLARAYFNFLLNKPLDSDIVNEMPVIPIIVVSIDSLKNSALKTRDEFSQMNNYAKILDYKLKIDHHNLTPTLSAVVDYGFQGEKYNFNTDNDFAMASFVLSWNIFKGFQNTSKIQQTKIEQEGLSLQEQELKAQIQLQVMSAFYELEARKKQMVAASQEFTAASESYKIINRKYLEGQVGLLEYLDAQNSRNTASKQLLVLQYDILIAFVELEKVSGIKLLKE